MAAAVHKLLHPHRSREEAREQERERKNSEMDRLRDEEKHTLAQWGEKKAPLEPGQIDQAPDHKMVGHSSRVLRKEDFDLIKTLGTGATTLPACTSRVLATLTTAQAPLLASGWCACRMPSPATTTKSLP